MHMGFWPSWLPGPMGVHRYLREQSNLRAGTLRSFTCAGGGYIRVNKNPRSHLATSDLDLGGLEFVSGFIEAGIVAWLSEFIPVQFC